MVSASLLYVLRVSHKKSLVPHGTEEISFGLVPKVLMYLFFIDLKKTLTF